MLCRRSYVHDPCNSKKCIRQYLLHFASTQRHTWCHGRIHRLHRGACQWKTCFHWITGVQNKVVVTETDRMWARLLSSTNQPSFLSSKDVEDAKKRSHRRSCWTGR
ncbi:unnamed protein product, partial [Musa acuminata var. zebrina]